MSSIEKAIDRLRNASHGKKPQEAAKPDVSTTETDNAQAPTSKSVGGEVSPPPLELSFLPNTRYLMPGCENKVLFEEYRTIKRPVLMNALGKGAAPIERGNMIAVTSALPGEGKTYTAVNLALSIATELDSTVLLIDGDILKASLSSIFGLEDNKGLTDLLSDPNTGFGDVLVPTQISKLKIIPAGSKHSHSTELLSSDGMEKLVLELCNRYSDRIILFDTPPLLATTEATVLLHLMGQIVLVVETGKTPVDALKESLSKIGEEKVVGMVLNKTNNRFGKTGYGYGGYTAGYY